MTGLPRSPSILCLCLFQNLCSPRQSYPERIISWMKSSLQIRRWLSHVYVGERRSKINSLLMAKNCQLETREKQRSNLAIASLTKIFDYLNYSRILFTSFFFILIFLHPFGSFSFDREKKKHFYLKKRKVRKKLRSIRIESLTIDAPFFSDLSTT